MDIALGKRYSRGKWGCDIRKLRWLLAGLFILAAKHVSAQASGNQQQTEGDLSAVPTQKSGLSAAQIFELADRAREARDFVTAEAAYRALSGDEELEIRTEARFRLGMMLAYELKRYSEAALEFRHILDDKPGAGRVRIELARLHAALGNLSAAKRELRAAEAAGLPLAVEQLVHFYSNSLRRIKPIGGSIEIALAPDSNINRATRSATLGTVVGELTIDKDARARSGIGASTKGQAYARFDIDTNLDLLLKGSVDARLYGASDFNDVSAGLQAGPQFTTQNSQFALLAGPTFRWYGGRLFSKAVGGNVVWQGLGGKKEQVRIEAGVSHAIYAQNPRQTGYDYAISVSIDRAISARTGVGVQMSGLRETAHDPGYSLVSAGTALYIFRELGRTTMVGAVSYGHLETDNRLSLYTKRRVEDRLGASIAMTLRTFHLGSFSPLIRLKWERNRSTIEIYDYRRIGAEFGVTSAF